MASASQIFRELDSGVWKPFYLVVGDEPFQAQEIFSKIKSYFVSEGTDSDFIYEAFEGEGLSADKFLESLEVMPGLFSPSGKRLVKCDRFEKVSASILESLDSYFSNPSETTCLVLLCNKVDKRKSWVKQVIEKGHLVEVSAPFDRDWPKWHPYFEKKCGKKIEAEAWEWLVMGSGKQLAVLWTEVEKLCVYLGNRRTITQEDVELMVGAGTAADVFQFVDEVVVRDRAKAMRLFHHLLANGESEIKLLSLLVRQFRILEKASRVLKPGVDPKAAAGSIGVHPFFVSKVQSQLKKWKPSGINQSLCLLSEADYALKSRGAGLFESFLIPYFSA